jgi:glycosyltransferase involved in cell wall biosynthesis
MKIGFFYRELDQGGIQRMIIDCANYFASKGVDVSVVLMKPSEDYHELLHKAVKILYFESIRQIDLYRSLSNILKREKFDLLYSATPALNIFSIVTKLLSRTTTKIVISEHNNTLVFFKNMKLTLSKLTYLSIPVLYRFADAIVAVSAGLGKSLQKIALINTDKIDVIHNPAYSPILEGQLKMVVDHEWFKDADVPVIITVGRLTEAKNHRLLLNAMALLLKRKKVRLIIIGEGHLRSALTAHIDQLNISDSVRLEGFRQNPVSWISQADLFVLSSDYEGFGIVLVEALAAGTTIVSTDCDYGPEEILGDQFGYLVPVNDAAALANKIEFALDHPISKDLLMERARDFSVERIMMKYNKLFTDVINK